MKLTAHILLLDMYYDLHFCTNITMLSRISTTRINIPRRGDYNLPFLKCVRVVGHILMQAILTYSIIITI